MELFGRLSKLLFKQPPQMASRHAEPVGERFPGLLFERSLTQEFEGPLDGGVGAVPRGRSGSGFGTTP
jgi:hypothetical protein